MDAEELINKLMVYYNIETITELSTKLNVSQPTISKWKKNNSYNTILKKCKKLNIIEHILINNDADKYEDIITNSIKYRFMEKSFNQSNLFKNELIVLLNSFSEIDITLNSLDDIIVLIKKYDISKLSEYTNEKHRNSLISLLYLLNDIEINYICQNYEKFLTLIEDFLDFIQKDKNLRILNGK